MKFKYVSSLGDKFVHALTGTFFLVGTWGWICFGYTLSATRQYSQERWTVFYYSLKRKGAANRSTDSFLKVYYGCSQIYRYT